MIKLLYVGVRRRLKGASIDQVGDRLTSTLVIEIGAVFCVLFVSLAIYSIPFFELPIDYLPEENLFKRRGRLLVPLIISYVVLVIPIYFLVKNKVIRLHKNYLKNRTDINDKGKRNYKIYMILLITLMFSSGLFMILR